jgi:hypothetical protein
MDVDNEKREMRKNKLRTALKERISAKQIGRSSKQNRENVLEKTLKEAGLDKNKFMEDLKKVGKDQTFEMSLKQ